MKRRANTLLAGVLFSALALLAGIGCQQADVEQAAVVRETEPKGTSTTTEAASVESTSSGERDAEAWVGDGKVVAKSGEAEARAGNGKAQAGNAVAGDGKARAGSAVAGDGMARAGDVVAGGGENAGSGTGALPGKVVFRVGGDPGTEFSGTCVVGGTEKEIAGRVPGRFVYELDGRELECEVRKVGSAVGTMEISVVANGTTQEAMLQGRSDQVSFALTEQGTTLSTFSSSGSTSSVSQKTKITSSSNSSVLSSSSSR